MPLLDDVDTRASRAAAAGGRSKPNYVRRIFSEIAPRYDLLNHLLSFNIDRHWRKRAIQALNWQREPAGLYLDLCAGTLDVGAMLVRTPGFRGRVVGADFAEPMLRAGRGKAPASSLSPVVADAIDLPLADGSVAGAIVSFGIRNVGDLDAALAEAHRVLAPGARFVILEFSTPPSAPVRAAYHLYFRRVLPVVGRLVSGHPTAYTYLPESVAQFPDIRALAARLRNAGFAGVESRSLTFGIATIHTATKG
jgi:demethylmenaquinone methyltransferase/2-methoxy-6-polyprenyl-1,4-benzoquinol methylase